MVFLFSSATVDPPALIFMGKDKFENEDLIKLATDEDIWFHVDKMSSAHVYLNLQTSTRTNWKNIPMELLVDCAQLVKANSIDGNKKDNVTLSYTPATNLLKSRGMEVGAVAFKSEKLVRKITLDKRDNSIVNRLNKTKYEQPLELFKKDRIEKRRNEQALQRSIEKMEKERMMDERQKMKDQEELKKRGTYGLASNDTKMKTNSDIAAAYTNDNGQIDIDAFEDDFM